MELRSSSTLIFCRINDRSAQELKEVFLPPGESDAAKIEFERRVQLPQENPDKKNEK